MKESALISVVIPCYNGKDFIVETINSVLKQKYTNFEILIVNDGSTDNSVEVIQSIRDKRIILIDKANTGVSDSRNLGFKKARGEFIIFLDADDLLSTNFFEKAIENFTVNRSVDYLTCGIIQIDEKSEAILNENVLRGTYENVQNEIVSFLPNISTCPSAYIYRKESLTQHNIYYNKALSSPADRYFLLEVGAHLKGGFMIEAKLKYRIHPNSMSHFKSEKLIIDQEFYLHHTLKQNLLKSKNDISIFKRKLAYQLFIDYLKMKRLPKALKYGGKYLVSFF
ncbi:glycosyltransferase family 2 protein [Brumimicrobium aurantiacum]|uniref:Glycosyltransferase family 2 protein n=1 Tax=Brumimicrobium aurantiacum TaxID=1737063 RepID=A0A3E1F1N5_9FLAO|nr:glycosyltransferase family 2 protein [Brumimicrobium aurantiacum]RFC55741.1 glycosyltransferase family 2 protein [Brumimicrobium aurantiacum]